MFLREIKGKNKTYLSLVEGYRENGKVKQRTLISFGVIDNNADQKNKRSKQKIIILLQA